MTQIIADLRTARPRSAWIAAAAGAVILLIAAGVLSRSWLSRRSEVPAKNEAHGKRANVEAGEHGAHDHGHTGHNEATSLELSKQAQQSIGLTVAAVKLQTFERTITVPGLITERPGKSVIAVTAPLTGVITNIFVIQGEAVQPGRPLFDLRLSHEELVQAQSDFLRTAEELDVIAREVSRLEKVAAEGAIAGKTLLERKYEQQKQQAVLRAQRQALLLHGLSETQVDLIYSKRTLLQGLTVEAPSSKASAGEKTASKPLILQELNVTQGQHVTAGDKLCTLANHAELLIQGTAFAQDASEIQQAVANNWTVSMTVEGKAVKPERVSGLGILYLANQIDPESRAFHFYVKLPNELLRDNTTEGRRFIYWRFKPGQRIQLHVPVERWADRIVLPVDAIAQDGAETFVFQANGDHFDRRAVRLEYRDQFSAVLANDGSIYPGDILAQSGAHQLQLALKNKSGGAIDPHAGHNH